MISPIHISRSVRNPVKEYRRILNLASKETNKDTLYSGVARKTIGKGLRYSKKEFNAIFNEMKAYELIDFEKKGKTVWIGKNGTKFLTCKNETEMRHLLLAIFLHYHPQLLNFLRKLTKKRGVAFLKPPSAVEYRSQGYYFTASNAEHRRGYISFCFDNVKKTLLRFRKDLPNMPSENELKELRRHMFLFVEEKVREGQEYINQKSVVAWTEFAILDYLLKNQFDNAFRNIPEFEVWQDRLFFLQAINYSRSFPLFNGSLLYSICSFEKSDEEAHYEQFTMPLGVKMFIHKPSWSDIRVEFTEVLKRAYTKLSETKGLSYVRIADLRDMVCYRLRLHDSSFDNYMIEAIKESVKGDIPIRLSLDSDIYPGRDHWKRRPLDLRGAAGKRTIICVR